LTVEALRTLPHPTLAIYGEYSFCLASCHGLRECLPSCEVKIVSEAGHYHPIIRSALFAETVRTFIHARSAPANDTRPHLYA